MAGGMRSAEQEVAGAHCRLVWGGAKAPLTVSLTRGLHEAVGPPEFGSLAYGLPSPRFKAVTTTLIRTPDQSAVDAAAHLAQVLATRFARPVYVNSSVGANRFLLYQEVTRMVEEHVEQASREQTRAAGERLE